MQPINSQVRVHLFGLARFGAMREFVELGVSSIDSASVLRKAWLRAKQNYLTTDQGWFSALRVPMLRSPAARRLMRAEDLITGERYDAQKITALGLEIHRSLRAYDSGDRGAYERAVSLCLRYAVDLWEAGERERFRRTTVRAPGKADAEE